MNQSQDGGPQNQFGQIGWVDLTVDDATAISGFYEAVIGWKREAVPVSDYHDYCVTPAASADPIAGICHARGVNSGMPAQWLMYISVPDLQASVDKCTELGGRTVCPPRNMGGYGQMAVIADPAGAVLALIQPN